MAREEKLKKRQKSGGGGGGGGGGNENGNGNGKATGTGSSSEGEAAKSISNLAYLHCQSSSPASLSPASPSSSSESGEGKFTHTSPPNSFDSLALGAFEVACIGEVKRAGRVFLSNPEQSATTIKSVNHPAAVTTAGNNSSSSSSSNLLQALSLQETYIRKIIDFCKSLASSFACLKPADQMIMVKNFFEDSLTIRCAFHYDYLQDGFPVMSPQQQQNFAPNPKTEFEPNGNQATAPVVKLPVIFPASKQHHLETYRKFIYALHNELEGDRNIRDLVSEREMLFCISTW